MDRGHDGFSGDPCIWGAFEITVPVFIDGFDIPSWNTSHGKWFGMPDQESFEQGQDWKLGPDSVLGDYSGNAYQTVRSVHTGLVDFEKGGFRCSGPLGVDPAPGFLDLPAWP